jgi:ectoine hydroxylase-related dioxygenase (phytanoyl-CoA dioxygenase family)
MPEFRLSEAQVRQFHEDGFIFVKGLFDAEEMELLIKIAKADKEMTDGGWIMQDAKGGASRINLKSATTENIYSAFVHSQRIAGPMEQLIGAPIYHWHHKMMLKDPYVGGAWEWHQDYGYWYNDNCLFPDMASCVIAVDRATKENGCLQVLRASHKIGRVNHGQFGGQAGADPKRVEAAMKVCELVYCEMEPGTALFFHGNTLHCSSQNKSPNPRWSLICCYNALHNKPFEGPGHGRPVPLEIWPENSIKEIGRKQWAEIQASRQPT